MKNYKQMIIDQLDLIVPYEVKDIWRFSIIEKHNLFKVFVDNGEFVDSSDNNIGSGITVSKLELDSYKFVDNFIRDMCLKLIINFVSDRDKVKNIHYNKKHIQLIEHEEK